MEVPSQQDFSNFVNGHTNDLSSLYYQLTDYNTGIVPVARNVPGAQQNDSARKNRVTQLVSEVNNYYWQLNGIVDAIERERESITLAVKEVKERLEVIRGELNEKKELEDLRKEQASDVKGKYAADYHSSVLGLWRPLHPNTRGVLYTISTVLMLIGVAAVGFLITTNKNGLFPARASSIINTRGSGAPPPTSLFDETNAYNRVVGGALKLRPKK